MKNIVFFVRHFTERGTEVSIFNYAYYNKKLLNNNSFIVCFTQKKQKALNWPNERPSYQKFLSEFKIIEINEIDDMSKIINDYNISYFYTQPAGGIDIYKFDNKKIWGDCKTIKHCVFNTTKPESDFYICISDYLNIKYQTNFQVIPYIVTLPNIDGNLRNKLNIPESAVIFGGYGGKMNFNIKYVQEAVYKVAKNNNNIYFLFANFNKFCNNLNNIIHLPTIIDEKSKVEFINTCDAMLWARKDGETFGLAIAEFSIKNKPVICTECGDLAHKYLLKDKAIWYNSESELINLLETFNKEEAKRKNWNAYKEYTPEKVMNKFKNILQL